MFDLVIRGTLALPEGALPGGWIAVSDGVIRAIGNGAAPEAAELFEADEGIVIPGVIDGQTHATSYGGLPGIGPTTRSAVAGGVTTIVDMPYDNPAPLNSVERLREKVEAIGQHAHANVALYGTVMPGQGMEVVDELVREGVVAFKISTFESSQTRFPRIGADQILSIFDALAATDIPLGVHNEDQEIVSAFVARAKAEGRDGIAAHSQSRPPAAELSATAQFLELGAAASAHAHIVHLSTARGFGLVDNYLLDGFRATGELCVHYLWFDPERDGAELGARMKVNPPIRPGQIEALWNEIIEGRVAFVSSDHASWPVDNKNTASIFEAGAGVPGLETLLPAFYTVADERGHDALALTVAHLCERPARFFGLWPEKGAIRIGADADLVVIRPDAQIWNSANAHDGLNWSPFDGRRFSISVARTWVGGHLAWDGTDIVNASGTGRYARRGSSRWFE
ncbi:amidohydrolase family protein [Rhizobiaceae bacterium BDR2-2]|uniref:Amidohydrolase family protein n=1 Tax=Ectorhizobium quercum TaxID=2965071 RepID=A0AAE3SUX0_9HYPH|nr:amidohydrolase family protein [Ectorhizobium quercum]MCX8997148.1 amidohydrolase family protein [Ectorhizobium quercum]